MWVNIKFINYHVSILAYILCSNYVYLKTPNISHLAPTRFGISIKGWSKKMSENYFYSNARLCEF